MESPTPQSENNLKRYKGIRTSKKSLYSCNDYYLKGENEVSLSGTNNDSLGPRSVSLTALVTEGKNKGPPSPSRVTQLETLEAKMASIEVSLANVAAAQQQAAPRRMKRNGLVGTARSLHSSHLGVSHHPPSREAQKEMEFLRQSLKDKENLILNLQTQLRKLSKRKLTHGSITSTDSGVVSLRILSENERKSAEERLAQLDKDMEVKRGEIKRITHKLERLDLSDNIDIRIQQAELEYELEREELNLLNLQEERRNLHTILDDNDAFQKRTENSLFNSLPHDSCVAMHSFEIVYDANDASFSVGKREDRTGTYVTWTRDDLKTLKRGDRIVELNGTLVISKGVNKIEEFWSDENSPVEDIDNDIDIGAHPLRIVIMRAPPPPPHPRAPNRELHNLKEELVLITDKLEQVTKEKREMQGLWTKLKNECEEIERFKIDNEKLSRERDLLKTEAVRLKHRISYLVDLMQQKEAVATSSSVTVFQKGNHRTIVAEEGGKEQTSELILSKETMSSSSSSSVTVFQKGNQKTIVAEGNKSSGSKNKNNNNRPNSPTRPPSVASSKQALKTRLWETFRRATSSDSRSVCSVDSSKHGIDSGYGYSYFKKRHSESKKNSKETITSKPPPPSKPLRLSLQRASSNTDIYPGGGEIPELNPGLRRSNYSENTLLPDWMSDHSVGGGGDSQTHECQRKKRNGKHHGIRWPSLRPASSMSYAMGNRSSGTTVAKF